ncbi:MAG: hypothetical protein E7317_11615 [Clostridiales bacterium]|nr:hypothetical protein [Clostridiales bacterium]
MSMIWPIALVVLSNTIYHICAKSLPDGVDPLASLTVTYLVAALLSALLYFALNGSADLMREYRQLNWAPFALGVVIIGLEAGFIYAYKAGWGVNTAQVVSSALLAVVLLGVGRALYQEAVTWNKVVGAAICLIGLAFINR